MGKNFLFVIKICEERELNNRINPAIYPAFVETENNCLKNTEQKIVVSDEYKRCKQLVNLLESQNVQSASAEEWYKYLTRLGFTLPPFRLEKPANKEEYNRAMQEQKQLIDVQTQILKQQNLNLDNKINNLSKTLNIK